MAAEADRCPERGWRPFAPVERAMARRMERAAAMALSTQYSEVDMAPVLAEVKRQRGEGVPATVTSVVLGVVAKALVDHPEVAAEVDYERWVRRVPESPGVGVAVATERGLVVPVVQRITELTFHDLAVELDRLVTEVRSGNRSPDLFRGGCFSVTNIGRLPITGGIPIPMVPQIAILGVSGTWDAPVVVDGEIAITKLARFTVGQDHRALDGMTAGSFLVAAKRYAEGVGEIELPASTPR
jgi:pyruvate/2-oxoglutarate dehydrogenase complex dihydrolipoamide acyltransferase (E2) component